MTHPGTVAVREGDLLVGKYRVERVLGAGGMGIVVAARHEQLDQMVAIKFVRDDALGNEEAVQRFLREARAAVKLKSEHVARVLDVGKLESGAPYMVMEYLEGSDLAKTLAADGPVAVATAAAWIMQACEAVAEAHAAGIVHRDLKPENLFLTNSVGGAQKIKVLDFGVSKVLGGASGELSSLTRTSAMLGSPLYMAPEQMRSSRNVDARTDIWALGVLLFQLLTQRWPFEAEAMPELCIKVVAEPPLSLAAFRPDAPAALVAAVERCLEKDPADRFASATDLAAALEPFAQASPRFFGPPSRAAAPVMGPPLGQTPSRVASAVSTPGSPVPAPAATATPGTSAAWGAERASALRVTPVPKTRAALVPLGVGLAIAFAVALLVVTFRGGGPRREPSKADGVVGAPPSAASPSSPSSALAASPIGTGPTALLSPAPEALLRISADAAGSVPTIASADAPFAPLAARPEPTAMRAQAIAPTGKGAPAEVRSATQTGKPAPNGADDDIPTLR